MRSTLVQLDKAHYTRFIRRQHYEFHIFIPDHWRHLVSFDSHPNLASSGGCVQSQILMLFVWNLRPHLLTINNISHDHHELCLQCSPYFDGTILGDLDYNRVQLQTYLLVDACKLCPRFNFLVDHNNEH